MDLSVFYSLFILFTLLSIADPTEPDILCPTSRRLLLFGGINLPSGGKKSHHSSPPKKPLPSSPPKYARSSDSHGLTVFIRPQTSNELGHKGRSYTHLLKSKLYTNEEKAILKRIRAEQKQLKAKNSSEATKTQELVAINDEELNRCKALLQIGVTPLPPTPPPIQENKKSKKEKPIKQDISSKVKSITQQPAKAIKNKATASTKVKAAKGTIKANVDGKKTARLSAPSAAKTNENRPSPSPVVNIPTKSLPSQSAPPPAAVNTKLKRTKPETITIIQQTTVPFNAGEGEIDDKNNSVVGRAYHFVKNIFQLSDDILDENQTGEDRIIDLNSNSNNKQQQQQHHHHSRKLLSLEENDTPTIVTNESEEVNLDMNNDQLDDSSFVLTSISKRQLLSVKPNKHSPAPKDKKQKSLPKTDANKPKVGWAYRYRISRYLEAQKMKRKAPVGGGGGKVKPTPASNTKVAKRKLLEYRIDSDDDNSSSEISDQNIVKTVSITKQFQPKRRLLTSKSKTHRNEESLEEIDTHDRKKSIEELTDPIEIVQSYDRGSYKPRVGWQFRYRVSRYIDSLRENIREDQERLKLGLQAIKRKTPQELSGRRKRVLDKPFAPDADKAKKQEEPSVNEQDNKPNAGWRYRYRISKMLQDKTHDGNIDKETGKRQAARHPQKKKSSSHDKHRIDVKNESIEEVKDLDPELRKINEEGRQVGWAFRYRIRRKLDYLKQQQAVSGIPFDLATLSGKREKKAGQTKIKSTEKKSAESTEEKPQNKTESAGWEYRYRISKMRDEQKNDKSKVSSSKKQDQHEPKVEPPTSNERTAGWEYRYRIRRKLDSDKNATTDENGSGKRAKKTKRKGKEKLIKKVEESIEKILNIDDIDETPFMEYVRRTSSYVAHGLLPTAKRTICLLRLPVTIPFCDEHIDDQRSASKKPKRYKKLKTKKEQKAKQFIHSRTTKLGAEDKATERRVDETMKKLYKNPSLPPPQTPTELQKKHHAHPSKQSKTIDGAGESSKKKIGVDSKKYQNKKQFQILRQEVPIKQKHLSPPSTMTTPPTPNVEPSITTATPRLRTLSEVIKEEATTILVGRQKTSRTPEEIQAEVDETTEIIQEQNTLKATTTTTTTTVITTTAAPTPIDSATSGEDDNGSPSTSTNDSEINQENVHNTPDLEKGEQ